MISLNIAVDNAGDLSTCSSFVEAAEWISEHADQPQLLVVGLHRPTRSAPISKRFSLGNDAAKLEPREARVCLCQFLH
jgi:hypothetical protein